MILFLCLMCFFHLLLPTQIKKFFPDPKISAQMIWLCEQSASKTASKAIIIHQNKWKSGIGQLDDHKQDHLIMLTLLEKKKKRLGGKESG